MLDEREGRGFADSGFSKQQPVLSRRGVGFLCTHGDRTGEVGGHANPSVPRPGRGGAH